MKSDRSGYTLLEVIIVVSLVAILSAIALPAFTEWRKGMSYRQIASDLANTMKRAKSKAIMTNLQHRVELNASTGAYTVTKGNYAYRSSLWSASDVTGGKVAVAGTFLNLSGATSMEISFNPNGTADKNAGIRIKDNINRYRVGVEQSGRITINKIN